MLAIGETMSITKLHEHFSKTPHNTTPKRMLLLEALSRRYLLGDLAAII